MAQLTKQPWLKWHQSREPNQWIYQCAEPRWWPCLARETNEKICQIQASTNKPNQPWSQFCSPNRREELIQSPVHWVMYGPQYSLAWKLAGVTGSTIFHPPAPFRQCQSSSACFGSPANRPNQFRTCSTQSGKVCGPALS